jgi:hypothetical protein
MDESPANQWDIPHYEVWDDGSEYEVFWVDKANHISTRRFHGPQFGLPLGEWKVQTS